MTVLYVSVPALWCNVMQATDHHFLLSLQLAGTISVGTPPREFNVVFDTSTCYFPPLWRSSWNSNLNWHPGPIITFLIAGTGLSWLRGSQVIINISLAVIYLSLSHLHITNVKFSLQCRSENCLDRCTYYASRSKTAVSTGHKYSVNYGDACVDTRVFLDTVTFSDRTFPNLPIGGAERMSGFGAGFDGYLGLGPNIQFNKTGKLYAGNGSMFLFFFSFFL